MKIGFQIFIRIFDSCWFSKTRGDLKPWAEKIGGRSFSIFSFYFVGRIFPAFSNLLLACRRIFTILDHIIAFVGLQSLSSLTIFVHP